MAGFDHGYDLQRPSVAVTRHRVAVEVSGRQLQSVEIKAFRDFGHGAGGLAGSKQYELALGRRGQQRRQAGRGVSRGYRGAKQALQKCARSANHESTVAVYRVDKPAYNHYRSLTNEPAS